MILPNITYVNFEAFMPRRIYTDGRDFPKDEEPSFMGYSIGKWLDTDNDGRYDTLEVETRNFKGPRTVEFSGIPLHDDNETVVKERIYLDKTNPEVMHNVITIIDHAFTRPWTVDKRYRRIRKVIWYEDNCNENNNHVVIGKENYFVSGDGYLMPTRKDQAPPDLRYFKHAGGKVTSRHDQKPEPREQMTLRQAILDRCACSAPPRSLLTLSGAAAFDEIQVSGLGRPMEAAARRRHPMGPGQAGRASASRRR